MSVGSPVSRSRMVLLFRHLFGESESAISSAPPNKLRQWLDQIKLELQRERNRGKARHYRYDFNRHLALASIRNIISKRLDQICDN